jgi:PAS domain-containing protein
VISLDEGQRVTLFNQGAERLFCFSTRVILGQPLDDLLPARFRYRHRLFVAEFAVGPNSARRTGERPRTGEVHTYPT